MVTEERTGGEIWLALKIKEGARKSKAKDFP
jgi:hypothetical protein